MDFACHYVTIDFRNVVRQRMTLMYINASEIAPCYIWYKVHRRLQVLNESRLKQALCQRVISRYQV